MNDIWEDRRVNIGYETAEELARCYNRENWRAHPENQRAATEESLDALGLIGQIKKNTSGLMFDGHLRVELALAKNPQMLLPVDYYDLNDDETALALAVHDAITEQAQPIPDKLAALLERTREMTADRPGLGAMLAALKAKAGINGHQAKAAVAQLDKAAELQKVWGVKVGDVWELGQQHRLACGDCTDRATVEAVMRGERADLGLTSPPYAVGKEYEEDVTFEQHLVLLRGVADRSLEAIKAGGFFFVNFGEIAPQSHTKPLTGSDRQCLYLISKDYWQIFHIERGFDLYAQRIWYKPFNRLQQPFWTYHTSIPHYQEWEHIWTWRLPGGNGDECYDWDISVRAVWDTRNESTDDKPLTRHVAAFPVGIPERAIKAHCLEGAIVWEPFSGSGTTLIACHQLNRRCRAIEIDPGYCSVTLQRYVDAGGQTPRRVSG